MLKKTVFLIHLLHLSTLQPSYEMGVIAFSLLLEDMICRKDNIQFMPKTIELPTSIVERESTLKK